MLKDTLRHLTHQGLQAVQAAGAIGAKATQEIEPHATAPELKEFLRRGSEQARTWTDRVAQAQQMVHGTREGGDNPIMRAHHEVAHRIMEHAQDPLERDLGIIAAGQLALHYYIAAYGTLASYTKRAGETEAASLLKQCSDEAKKWDEEHSELAKRLMENAS